MARKKIGKNQYTVTQIGYCVGGDRVKAREMARRAGRLRSDIWNKYGSLQAWGISHQKLYKAFQETNPPSFYKISQKQWQKTFERVIDDIHACQEAAKSIVVKKIYRNFKPQKDSKGNEIEDTSFRKELLDSLKTLEWMDYPLIHRWMRDAYHRGQTYVNNQICIGIDNGATVERVSKNVIKVTTQGDLIKSRKYEQLSLFFKVGRTTPKGLFRIIFDDFNNEVRLHYPKVLDKNSSVKKGSCGLDKGYTEAFTDSNCLTYGEGIGKVMQSSVSKRHKRGKARNKLYQIAKKKGNYKIFRSNLTKKRHNRREKRKKETLNTKIRAGINKFFDHYNHAITEDLSFVVKNKKQSKKVNRNLAEWCKGTLQKSLDDIATRRNCQVSVVNAAYTSQVDSRYGVLLGTRKGDQFFTFDGEVLSADGNAARNIETRLTDSKIPRYLKSIEVRKVLIKRTVSFLRERGYSLEDAINFGWFNSKHLKGITLEKAMALE